MRNEEKNEFLLILNERGIEQIPILKEHQQH